MNRPDSSVLAVSWAQRNRQTDRKTGRQSNRHIMNDENEIPGLRADRKGPPPRTRHVLLAKALPAIPNSARHAGKHNPSGEQQRNPTPLSYPLSGEQYGAHERALAGVEARAQHDSNAPVVGRLDGHQLERGGLTRVGKTRHQKRRGGQGTR